MCVAFRLLHDFGTLKPGDGVILNAANSTVGTCVIQLCRCLKLRPIAVVRDPGTKEDMDKLVARLKALGAAEARAGPAHRACCMLTSLSPQVLVDGGSIKAKLEENKFFAKPRLALDAVGGPSAVALANALQDGCPVVMCVPGSACVFARDVC
jgi:trans-2-enoyl-CoA reductase